MLTIIKFSFNKILNWSLSLVIKYPASKRISYFWNGGSILGIILSFQILTGIFLVFFYCPRTILSFDSIDFLSREVNFGFIFRSIHLNLASLFFFFLYLHLFRNLIYKRYQIEKTWLRGVSILILLIITAFLGYVLPWGQISFWGATVITNLISTIPIFGTDIVIWIWGGYNVNNATLSFFFTFHFLVPFIILILVLFHLIFLHETRRTSNILIHERFSKIKFFPYFIFKDLINFFLLFLFFFFVIIFPWNLGDPENWIYANPMISPEHIQPEWYFLFAYAILRAIPNKLGGVIALIISVFIFFIFPFTQNYKRKRKIYLNIKVGFFIWVFIVLTWLGACIVESPFILLRQLFRFFYFFILILFNIFLIIIFDLKSNTRKFFL